MSEPARPVPVSKVQFGPFVVDAAAGELRKHGVRIKIQERPLRLLVALLEKPRELVTREELRQRIWPDGTFVDFDHNISSCVNKLRGALNDTARNPRYIETLGRRGYRFLADCKPVIEQQDELATESASVVTPVAPSKTLPTYRRWLLATGLLLIVLCGFFLLNRLHRRLSSPVSRPVLVVLLFE